jgi:hypothetical protein
MGVSPFCAKQFFVPKATHLFEESGTLEQVSNQANNWFREHLTPPETH